MWVLHFITILALSAFCTTALGWMVHWAIHKPWSGWFYRAHMNHHQIQYPPTNFFSTSYRSAGADGTTLPFLLVASPLIILLILAGWYGLLTLGTLLTIALGTAGIGIAHDRIHESLHSTQSWLEKWNLFQMWRKLHFVHHLNMSTNYGIFFFLLDKLFGTYEETNDNILG